ncbi:MAG: hypothetical protein R3316_10420 [Rhodovibrionaceae bacterium]|nr:hypothetical protein [Rhodovibrionaceae bacterium]
MQKETAPSGVEGAALILSFVSSHRAFWRFPLECDHGEADDRLRGEDSQTDEVESVQVGHFDYSPT